MNPDTAVRAFVGVFPVNDRAEVLLQLRDDRPDLDGAGTWSTLGGLIEPGETPEAAARREMIEECGHAPGRLTAVAVRQWLAPGAAFERRFHVFATPAGWSLDDLILGEGQALAWHPAAAVPALPLNPLIAEDILAFAGSLLVPALAALAPPSGPPRTADAIDAVVSAIAVPPGGLAVLAGATAAFAGRLRAALPPGARLTASPAPYERAAALVWWPARAESIAERPPRWSSAAEVWVVFEDMGDGPRTLVEPGPALIRDGYRLDGQRRIGSVVLGHFSRRAEDGRGG